MCDYCDCRALAPIRELSDEHDRISALMGQVRKCLAAGTDADGAAPLVALQDALGRHLAKEEAGLFAQLSVTAESASYLEGLAADHARARAGLLAVDAGSAGWAEITATHQRINNPPASPRIQTPGDAIERRASR